MDFYSQCLILLPFFLREEEGLFKIRVAHLLPTYLLSISDNDHNLLRTEAPLAYVPDALDSDRLFELKLNMLREALV